MAVVSIKNKLRRGNLLVGNDPFIPTDFESIATVTVGSGGAADVEFTSIPATYTHLQVRAIMQSNRGTYSLDDVFCRINNDVGSNYAFHKLYGDGSSASAENHSTQSYMSISFTSSSATANIFGALVLDVLDYANTNKYKTLRNLGGMDINGTTAGYGGRIGLISGLWQSTSAVTSIKFYPQNGTQFNQYSHFALYGIKGA
jgi:hypothetical protein